MVNFSNKLCNVYQQFVFPTTMHQTNKKEKNEDAHETITSENVFQSKHQSSLFCFTVISLKNKFSAASNNKMTEIFRYHTNAIKLFESLDILFIYLL